MKESSVYIESHSDITALQRAMQSWREDMGRLLNAVDSYLLDRLRAYKDLEEYLRKELEKAETALKTAEEIMQQAQEKLSRANAAYSSCCASQRWVEDEDGNGEWRPSCASKAAAAARAESHCDKCKNEYDRCLEYRDECKARYEKCVSIVRECAEVQAQYKERGFLYTGAEEWIRSISEEHTKKGCDKIDQILEILGRYHNRNLTVDFSDTLGVGNRTVASGEPFLAASEHMNDMEARMPSRAERFNMAKQKLESELIPSSSIQQPSAIAICPDCNRPIPICKCPRIYERTR